MATVSSNLRLNMTGAEADPALRARRYRTAIDMASYADQHGFTSVNVEEHHVANNGWLPSPLTMAAAIAARTERCSIGVMALLITLYDPIRLAEDIAVVDLLSQGRLNFIAGMGYREVEFHIANKPFADEARQIARRIAVSPALRLTGIECYEGTSASCDHAKDRATVQGLMDRVDAIAREAIGQGWFAFEEIILSAGGSAIFDLVAERLTPSLGRPVRGVLRSGCYLTHDHQRYQRYLCCVAERLNLPGGGNATLKPALEVLACVQSCPEPGLALLGMGKRDVAHDLDLPLPIWRSDANGGAPRGVPVHWRIDALNDQHAYLRYDPAAPEEEWPTLGETVASGISHPCTTFDKWRWLPVVDDAYRVVDAVTTWF